MAVVGLFLVQALLGIIGSALCALVPLESGAKLVIVFSLILDVAVIPLGVYLFMTDLPPLIAGAVSFVSWILFMMFLMRLAYYVRENGLAHEAGGMIVRGLALLVLVPLVIVLLGMMAFLSALASPTAIVMYRVVAVILAVADLFFLLQLAFNLLGMLLLLRESIRHGLRKSEAGA